MVEPNTLQEQMKETQFIPDEKLVLYFATSKFDKVWRKDEATGKVV